MDLYHCSCPWVWAHACSWEYHPGNQLPGFTTRAIWVATTSPILPFLMEGKETVFFPRSGRSSIPFSPSRICRTVQRRSRFHSIAFMARSRWASKHKIRLSLVPSIIILILRLKFAECNPCFWPPPSSDRQFSDPLPRTLPHAMPWSDIYVPAMHIQDPRFADQMILQPIPPCVPHYGS